MSRLSHTPEPWSTVFDRRGDCVLIGPRSEVITYTPAFRSADQHAANLQRIALCVNACAGLSDHQLQQIAAGHCSLTEVLPDGQSPEDHPMPQARHPGETSAAARTTATVQRRSAVGRLF